MSTAQTTALQKCQIGLHESWAGVQLRDYSNIFVKVAFLTPQNEILLVNSGNLWQIPQERLLGWNTLIGVPDQVIQNQLKLAPAQLKDASTRRKVKILGSCEVTDERSTDLFVFMTAPIIRIYKQGIFAYIQDYSQLDTLTAFEAMVHTVVTTLGWKQPEATAAA